jgi:hypothetical protein
MGFDMADSGQGGSERTELIEAQRGSSDGERGEGKGGVTDETSSGDGSRNKERTAVGEWGAVQQSAKKEELRAGRAQWGK